MTATQSLKLFEISKRYFQNENDARSFVEEIETVVENKFFSEKKEFSSKIEVEFLRKDVESMRAELKAEIVNSSLRVENSLKSELNKHLIWIVATVFAMGSFFIAMAKFLF